MGEGSAREEHGCRSAAAQRSDRLRRPGWHIAHRRDERSVHVQQSKPAALLHVCLLPSRFSQFFGKTFTLLTRSILPRPE